MNQLRAISTALLILASGAGTVLARTWTDSQGRQIQGTFVRVEDGQVSIETGRRILQVPLDKLSPQDIEYVRKKLPPDRQGEVPGGPEPRKWTDFRGRELEGTFARLDNSQGEVKVVLLRAQDQKELKVPFAKLCADDQAFLRRELASTPSAQMLPPESAAPQVAANSGNNNLPQQPQIGQPPISPRFNRAAPPQQIAQAPMQPAPFQPPPVAQSPRFQPPGSRRFAPPAAQPPVVRPQPVQPSGPQFGYYCSACNKPVAGGGAGDRCPHCGVYFDYVEKPGGGREYASGSSWEFTPRFYAKMIAIIVAAVVSVVVRSMRGQ